MQLSSLVVISESLTGDDLVDINPRRPKLARAVWTEYTDRHGAGRSGERTTRLVACTVKLTPSGTISNAQLRWLGQTKRLPHGRQSGANARSTLVRLCPRCPCCRAQRSTADLTALDQALHALVDVLRQSGVGIYPLPASAPDARNASPPTRQQLIADTTRSVRQLYEEFKRVQRSSAVAANLLAGPESAGRPEA